MVPEITREQEDAVERIACRHGRVHVNPGFAHGVVRATVPNGAEFTIAEDGCVKDAGVRFGIDWNAS